MTAAQTPFLGKIWHIAPEDNFLVALADGVWTRFGVTSDFALSDVTILLPTRRACRVLQNAFLQRAGDAVILLPRMMPLGDLDQDALFFESEGGIGADFLTIPPPVSPLARQCALAQFLAIADPETATPQRFRLAGELGRLLDQWQTEGLDTTRLAGLPDERFAEHWQKTLKILAVILEYWPAVLDERGLVDPARHRNLLLAAQAEFWRIHPPAGPIIAAGSTGSLPATAALLAVIAGLPGGEVVLPGLDTDLANLAWEQIEESHPQFMLKKWLDRLAVDRTAVALWPSKSTKTPNEIATRLDRRERMRLMSLAMMPAAAGELWQQGDTGQSIRLMAALRGITRIDAATAEEEALVIALILRRVLEQGDKKAALVTPDRQLARRVTAMMARWGIIIDDSAGMPLSETALGSWLRQTARFALTPDAQRRAVEILALLKHPLAGLGRSAGERLALVRLLERKILRGPALAAGWGGLRAAILAADDKDLPSERQSDLLDLLDQLIENFAEMATLRGQRVGFSTIMAAHGKLVETLSSTDCESGAARCWDGAAGEAAAGFFSDLRLAADHHPPLYALDYADLLDDWLLAVPVRSVYGGDSRVGIWGPLEARLQQADVIILSGLNEGVWPGDPPPDAWLSRPMRRALNLPTPERRIGQSAHDFVAACGATEIYLTRAERQGGAPSVPSRWLQRLDGVLRVLSPNDGDFWLDGQKYWLRLARGLDFTALPQPVGRPAPCPLLERRPNQWRITDVETLLVDPYDFYAKWVLRLRPLDPLEQPPDAAARGTLIHDLLYRVLEDWRQSDEAAFWPDNMVEKLLAEGQRLLKNFDQNPIVQAFWWPRLERIIRAFDDWQRADVREWLPIALETKGQWVREHGGHRLTLIGRADRIDRHCDLPDQARIVDYKTGTLPTKKELESGRKPQLALTGMMMQYGGFGDCPGDWQVSNLAYLAMGNKFEDRQFIPIAESLMTAADVGLDRVMAAFFAADFAFTCTGRGHGDYHYLARVAEWLVLDDDDGDDEI
jgi:ATP-dependent helicase/nuclease subunit B